MLYGRDPERARIGALLERARASRSGVLVVRGEPGLGKTALLEDTRDRAVDMRVLSARGVESEAELPFAVLHRLLRPALGRIELLPARQAEALRGALGLGDGGAEERFLVYAACLTLLSELAEQRPLLCLVDDAHWLDAASADALLFVARRLDAEGIVMLFGARDGDVRRFDADDLPSMQLTGIDPEAAGQLLARAARGEPAPGVRDHLLSVAAGNALALLELPETLSDAQLSGREPLPAAMPLTSQLERAFLDRVRRLPDGAQRALLVAAGDDSELLGTLTRALDAAGVSARDLADTERAGLLRVHGSRFEFRHPLVRSAVYGAATSVERSTAHAALAAAAADDPDRRAWHLAAAALEPDEEAVRALEEAAERAQERSGYPAAARALERAAELSADRLDRGRRLVAAARAASLAGQTAHASALADRAGGAVEDPLLAAEIARVRAVAGTVQGRGRSFHAELLSAARAVAGVSAPKAFELLSQAAESARELGDAQLLLEVCAVAEQVPGGDESLSAQAIAGFGAFFSGDTERGVRMMARAIAAVSASDDPQDMVTIGVTASWMGDYEHAEQLLDRASTIARSRGAVAVLCRALAMRAPQLSLAQRFDEAAMAADEGVRLCRELGFENLLPLPLSVLAVTNATHGRRDEARALADEAQRLAVAQGAGAAAGAASWALVVLDVTAGRWGGALERLNEMADPRPGVSNPFVAVMSAPDRVEIARRAGRLDTAREALALFEGWASQARAPWAQPLLDTCRALVCDGADATAHFEAALARSSEARPLDLARTQLLFGEHLRRERRRVDARGHLRAALEGFERLGAVSWVERARSELRASGETARKRDTSTLGELTPQELQVGRLVAEGLSNKEVAAQLFLSPRTIEAHLRSVFSKLDVTSRTQLARHPQFGDHTDASTGPVAQAASHAQL